MDQANDGGMGQVRFPLCATIAGIEVVTILLADYAAQLECRRRVSAQDEGARRFAIPPRAPIEKDAEVRAFFEGRSGKMDMLDNLTECRRRFGRKSAR